MLLRYAVETLGVEDEIGRETIVEQAKPPAQNGFWRLLAFAADPPGKTQSGRPIGVIGDVVLRLKPQAAAQSEIGTQLPVILYVQSRIHKRNGDGGHNAARGRVDRKLAGQAGKIILVRVESVAPVKAVAGSVHVVNRAQSDAEFNEILALGERGVILKFVVVLMVGLRSRGRPSAGKAAEYVDAYGGAYGSLAAVVAQVLEARLIHHFRSKNLRIAELKRVLSGFAVVTGLGQR